MAETEELQAVQHFAERVENFVEDNKQAVAIGAGALVVIIAASLFVFLKWLPERNLKAQREIFMAEIAFQKDSFNLALNGNGVNKGFLEVQKKYGWTKAANLCNYYIGICYLNTGKYADAVTYLDKFSTSDAVLGAAKLNAIGDAYAEQSKAADAEKKIRDSIAAKDTTAKKAPKKEELNYKATETDVKVFFKKATPTGTVLLLQNRIFKAIEKTCSK
mgnify:FL=1